MMTRPPIYAMGPTRSSQRLVRASMKALYGFNKPYDFHKILPFLAGLFLLLTILVVSGARFAATRHLSWGALREAYLLYVIGLSLAGMLLSIFPRIAWLVLTICFTEFLIGVGGYALTAIHVLPRPLFPPTATANVGQFQYHPLLQVIPTPNYSRLHPFAISHDSNGIRGPERTSTELKQQVVIATVGSSTTYDVAVPNGQTWSDDLEQQLGRGYAVINHGVPGYSSVENLLQTLFYLDTYGVRPHCAVYLGWNDIRNAHLPNLDPAYANFHLLSQFDIMNLRKKPLEVSFSPLARVMNRSLQAAFDPVPLAPNFLNDPPVPGTDVRLEQIFRRNLEAIAAINRERQIISIFIGQVWSRAKLQSRERYGFFPLVRDVDIWPLEDHFNSIVKSTANSIGVSNFIPPIDQFHDDDFADRDHFSAKGSAKFALMITPIVKSSCK
jgi:lysophospholipase L1-like esterase